MTIESLATQLFTDFSPEERNVPDVAPYHGRNAAVLSAINSAMQELFGEGSPWLRYDEKGVVVKPATVVTIAVTNGSDAATITGWESWMAGCTLQIVGSSVDNQIRNAANPVALKFPYDGTTGTKSATVYHNSITVPDTVLHVLDPVRFNSRKLTASVTSELPLGIRRDDDFGFDGRFQSIPDPQRIDATLGTPVAYCVETWSPSDSSAPSARMRLLPATGEGGFLDYRVMLAPPTITDITSQDTLPVPQQFTQSILYPIARKHLSGCPFFRSSSAADEINRSYQEARRMLDKLSPARNQGRVMRSLY